MGSEASIRCNDWGPSTWGMRSSGDNGGLYVRNPQQWIPNAKSLVWGQWKMKPLSNYKVNYLHRLFNIS